jgi:hypothetical protein
MRLLPGARSGLGPLKPEACTWGGGALALLAGPLAELRVEEGGEGGALEALDVGGGDVGGDLGYAGGAAVHKEMVVCMNIASHMYQNIALCFICLIACAPHGMLCPASDSCFRNVCCDSGFRHCSVQQVVRPAHYGETPHDTIGLHNKRQVQMGHTELEHLHIAAVGALGGVAELLFALHHAPAARQGTFLMLRGIDGIARGQQEGGSRHLGAYVWIRRTT